MAAPFHGFCYLELRGPLQLFIGIGKQPGCGESLHDAEQAGPFIFEFVATRKGPSA